MLKKQLFMAILIIAVCAGTLAADPAKAYNIKMRRTDMPDITDVDSILNSVITGGMSNTEKAKAIWRVVFQYSHQASPPAELLAGCTHDPIKLFNVYGYRMCCCASACNEVLVNAAGFANSRTRQITNHNVYEVYYEGDWHMYDSSLICYFDYLAGGGDDIASVDEIFAEQGNLINQTNCPQSIYGGGGWYPALTHDLTGAFSEYSAVYGEAADGFSNGHSIGYRCVLTLREGESLERSCLNDGSQRHVNDDGQGGVPQLTLTAGVGEGQYFNLTIPDQDTTQYYVHEKYNGGNVGNGILTYIPELAGGGFRRGMISETDIACTADDSLTPALHTTDGTGEYIFRMECPYIFLDGTIDATVKSSGAGSVKFHVSTNNMLSWTEVWSSGAAGTSSPSIDIEASVNRRYSYFIKVAINSASPTGAGLDALTVSNLVQHAQRAMPFLVNGTNQFLVETEGTTGTITIEPRLTSDAAFTDNESLLTMGAVLANANNPDGGIWDTWGSPMSATFPVETPGDMFKLRIAVTYRLRSPGDKMAIQVSTDGTNFTQIHEREAQDTEEGVKAPVDVEYSGMPGGTRQMWVRFIRTGISNTVGISGHLRIDADYTEASATALPFKIKHEWTDNDGAKEHTEEVTTASHTYSVPVNGEPTLSRVTTWVEYQDTAPIVIIGADATQTLQTSGTVNFTATASDIDGTITLYEWDLDGNGSFETNTGTTNTVSTTFASAGTVNIKVRVTDNDGLTGESNTIAIDVQADSDNDGMGDVWEAANGLNVGSDDSQLDLDADGLKNIDEWLAGSEANNGDTDGDGIPDGSDPSPTVYSPAPEESEGTKGGCGTGTAIPAFLALLVVISGFVRRRDA